jgi:serine/threonine protein kinase
MYKPTMHLTTAEKAQCEIFRSCRPPLMHKHLMPENVYLDSHRRRVQLVDVGFEILTTQMGQRSLTQQVFSTEGSFFPKRTYMHA